VNRSREHFGENLLRRAAALHLLGSQVLALGIRHDVQVLQRESLLFREAERRASRLADGIVGHRLWRPGHFVHHVRLFFAQAAEVGDESAWSAEGLDGHTI